MRLKMTTVGDFHIAHKKLEEKALPKLKKK